MALGAGVSYGCGIPAWEALLARLADSLPGEKAALLYRHFKDDDYSLPVIASVLEALYVKKKSFTKAIKEQLYKEFPFSKINRKNRAEFIEFVKGKNQTLASVASLCTLKDGADSFVPNPRIHAIVNTNYDQTLQAYMHARYKLKRENKFGRKHVIRSIERPSAGSVYGAIPVYYMHGYIRFDKAIDNYHKSASDLRVLTEQDFFDFFNNPSSLFNYTVLYLLREYPCLFIGMSLKDDNVRRLLHYSKKERRKSYQKEGEKSDAAEQRSNRHFALLKYPTKKAEGRKKPVRLPELAEATEIALKRLGVSVLWLDDFSEIVERLRDLYQSTSPKPEWTEVF